MQQISSERNKSNRRLFYHSADRQILKLSRRRPVGIRCQNLALSSGSMAKSQCRTGVSPQWNGRMVHSREDFLRMAIIKPKSCFMDSWQTSVTRARDPYSFGGTNEHFLFTAGSGKTVLWYVEYISFWLRELTISGSSTVVQEIDAMRIAGLASLAFFYCEFKNDQKRDRRPLLSSLLVQLCDQSDAYCNVLSELYSAHYRGSQDSCDFALTQCLKSMLTLPGQAPVYIVIDAIDECPNTTSVPSPHDTVLGLVEELVHLQVPNLRICITSRLEADIHSVLDPLTFRFMSLHNESGQLQDIADYIRSVVDTDSKMQKWKPADKKLVIEVLTKKADGM
jgi:hypothetical protein